MDDRLLTAEEAAELLNVKLSWVQATREGLLPFVPLGRYRRYVRQDLLGFIDRQRRRPL